LSQFPEAFRANSPSNLIHVRCRELLGVLLKFYYRAAGGTVGRVSPPDRHFDVKSLLDAGVQVRRVTPAF